MPAKAKVAKEMIIDVAFEAAREKVRKASTQGRHQRN